MPHDAERLYFRMILKMLSREGGLPDDDAENARIFGYDRRVFSRLKAKLIAWPNAIYVEDGLLKNARVENDIADFKARRSEAVENGRKGGLAKAEVSKKSGESPAEVSQKSTRIPHTTNNEINEIAVASPSPSPSPSPEEENPPFIPPLIEKPADRPGMAFWSRAMNPEPPDEHKTVSLTEDGRIVLHNGTRARWLAKFGSEERLDLALTQAAGWVQPHSSRPLQAQVEAQLARAASDKLDRDVRYQIAAKSKAKSEKPKIRNWS